MQRSMKLRLRHPSTPELHEPEPLYRRAPSRDEDGRPLSDFMMLIPGLRDLPQAAFRDRVAGIQAILGDHPGVVFADLNVPINVLWVSIRPEIGLISSLASAIQDRIPEALLVASDRS